MSETHAGIRNVGNNVFGTTIYRFCGLLNPTHFEGQGIHPMIDITAIRDEKLQPPFMHTTLKIARKLKNRVKKDRGGTSFITNSTKYLTTEVRSEMSVMLESDA